MASYNIQHTQYKYRTNSYNKHKTSNDTTITLAIATTGFGKSNHLCTFIVGNVNLKNSLKYNSAIANSRSMGLALEIKYVFSFK